MIVDRLENLGLYAGITPRLGAALKLLRDSDLVQHGDGRYELQGSEIYAMVQSYQTKAPDRCRWEAHRKYIDIQYVIEGAERMGVKDAATLRVSEAYDPEKDVMFFHDDEGSSILVPAGYFAIFFPHDAHRPCLAIGEPASVKKVVIKVAV